MGDEGSMITTVPNMRGKGISIEPPQDRASVVNNVIKPFKAGSEIDRNRAT